MSSNPNCYTHTFATASSLLQFREQYDAFKKQHKQRLEEADAGAFEFSHTKKELGMIVRGLVDGSNAVFSVTVKATAAATNAEHLKQLVDSIIAGAEQHEQEINNLPRRFLFVGDTKFFEQHFSPSKTPKDIVAYLSRELVSPQAQGSACCCNAGGKVVWTGAASGEAKRGPILVTAYVLAELVAATALNLDAESPPFTDVVLLGDDNLIPLVEVLATGATQLGRFPLNIATSPFFNENHSISNSNATPLLRRRKWDPASRPRLHVIPTPRGRNWDICKKVTVVHERFASSDGNNGASSSVGSNDDDKAENGTASSSSLIEVISSVTFTNIADIVRGARNRFETAASRPPVVLQSILDAERELAACLPPTFGPAATDDENGMFTIPPTLIVDGGYVRAHVKNSGSGNKAKKQQQQDAEDEEDESSSSSPPPPAAAVVLSNSSGEFIAKNMQRVADIRVKLAQSVPALCDPLNNCESNSNNAQLIITRNFPALWIDANVTNDWRKALTANNAAVAEAMLLKSTVDFSVAQCGVDVLLACELVRCAAEQLLHFLYRQQQIQQSATVASESKSEQRGRCRIFLVAGDGDLAPAVALCRMGLGCPIGLVASQSSCSRDLRDSASFVALQL